jgi:hypothetical protein
MTWTRNENDVNVVLVDHPIEMDVDKVKSRRSAPVSKQTGFHVLALQRLLEERVVEKIDLPDREIVRRAPIGVDFT